MSLRDWQYLIKKAHPSRWGYSHVLSETDSEISGAGAIAFPLGDLIFMQIKEFQKNFSLWLRGEKQDKVRRTLNLRQLSAGQSPWGIVLGSIPCTSKQANKQNWDLFCLYYKQAKLRDTLCLMFGYLKTRKVKHNSSLNPYSPNLSMP